MPSVVLVLWCLSAHAIDTRLVVQFSSEPTQMDPLLLEDLTSLRIAANTLATPFEYDGSGKLQPALAESLTSDPSHQEFTLKFKPGLKWSDGIDFKAEDFHRALIRIRDEKVKAALSELYPKLNYDATKVVDDRTIRIVLKSSEPDFPHWLTGPAFAPIREDMIRLYQVKHTQIVPTLAAYRISEYKREDHLTLTKNPNFYDAASVSIPEILIRYVRDEAALLPLFKAGKLDVLTRVPVLQLFELSELGKVAETPVQAITYLGLNTKKPPLNDLRQRKALLEVIQAELPRLAQLLKTGEKAASCLWLDAKAQDHAHLPGDQSAGSPAPARKPSLRMQSDVSSRNQSIMEFLQDVLKRKLGWKADLDLMDFKAHYAKLKTEPDAAYRFGWQNPVDLPVVTYQVFRSDSPNNFTGWKSERYDQLVEALSHESEKGKPARKIMDELETILREEAPMVPLLHQVLRYSYSKRVLGFRANPFGVMLFREIRLQGERN